MKSFRPGAGNEKSGIALSGVATSKSVVGSEVANMKFGVDRYNNNSNNNNKVYLLTA